MVVEKEEQMAADEAILKEEMGVIAYQALDRILEHQTAAISI